ncbi:MAG: Nif3-like dinuclear metal center hexameric protein [Flavobacteriaceae bacterium]|nr:Nif3-like dinuclear metal center hexameric protein [Flavobacteriaceae bacterium]
MKIQEILSILEQWAPTTYAEDFDNVGLLIGKAETECTGILITHDVLENVVDEAVVKKYNFIVCFHPIIFSGLKNLTGKTYVERVVAKAIKNDIAIYAIHTALDNLKKGVSYTLANALGLSDIQVLIPQQNTLKQLTVYVPKENASSLLEQLYEAGAGALGNYDQCSFVNTGTGSFRGNENTQPHIGKPMIKEEVDEVQLNLVFQKHLERKILQTLFENHPYEAVAYELHSLDNQNSEIGMGSVGTLKKEMTEEEFLKWVGQKLETKFLRHSGFLDKKIKKVAVLGGSGSFAITKAKQIKADALVTADLKYHDFFQAENQILLVDGGHYETERFTKKLIHDHLTEKLPNFAFALSKSITNPVKYFSDGKKE